MSQLCQRSMVTFLRLIMVDDEYCICMDQSGGLTNCPTDQRCYPQNQAASMATKNIEH